MREEAGGRGKKEVVDIWAIITNPPPPPPPPPKKIRNRDEAEWGFALALACTSNCLYPAIGSAFPRKKRPPETVNITRFLGIGT